LAAPRVSDACLPWILNFHSGISVCSEVVSDLQAVESCKRFADDHRILVETACGAALAPLYYSNSKSHKNDPIIVIVCGGNSVDRSLFHT
jgi:threonine dehydratase